MSLISKRQRETLTQEIALLERQYAAYKGQYLASIDPGQKVILQQRLNDLNQKIEQLNDQLKSEDRQAENRHLNLLSLENSWQKIDFSKPKTIIKKLDKQFGNESGAMLLFLQNSTERKGDYCIQEILDLIIKERTVGNNIIGGDFRSYPVNLASLASKFNEDEFSKRLASHLNQNPNISLHESIITLCSSLQGGSTVFIKVENWDCIIDQINFLDWFMRNFWEVAIKQLKPIFQNYSKIRFIVTLIAKGEVFSRRSPLPDFFCKNNEFDDRKIIELPLSNWTEKHIQDWLICFQGLSNQQSLELAQKIKSDSKGKPNTICSILESKFKVCQ